MIIFYSVHQPKISPFSSIKSVRLRLPMATRLRATKTRPLRITVPIRPTLPASIPNRAIETFLTTSNPSFGTSRKPVVLEAVRLVWDGPIPCRAIPLMPARPIKPFIRPWERREAVEEVEEEIVVLRREQWPCPRMQPPSEAL